MKDLEGVPGQVEAVSGVRDGDAAALVAALERADACIEAMSDYLGKMALSGDQLRALNEHWLFVQREVPGIKYRLGQ